MPVNISSYQSLIGELAKTDTTLVAVSKTKPFGDILELYNLGQRDFGENYVQELVDKAAQLPNDILWHFIGHLQTNKVKLIVPFVQLIHGVDSLKLLNEINKEAAKMGKVVNCLLQIHIALEETKFGFDEAELANVLSTIKLNKWPNVNICGLMGMGSFTDDIAITKKEFKQLKSLYDSNKEFKILSMGMSGDYKMAMEAGSTMVRVGSLLFGERQKKN